jgi:hypothetical protein
MAINWRALTPNDVPSQPLLTLLAGSDQPVSLHTLALAEPVKEGPVSRGHAASPQILPKKPKPPDERNDMQAKTLFSQHYLDNRLPDHPEWAEDPAPALEAIRPLWQKAAHYGESWNEAQTEEEFIRPILDILGWSYMVQAKSKKAGQVTRPDYALFPDAAARDAAYPYQGDDDAFYGRAPAIGEAKYWGRPLSQKDSSGRNTWKAGSNPSHQMVSYLVGTRSPWGVLTNGRVWRLYSREVSSTASEFYEVDLGLVFDFLPQEGEPGPAQLNEFRRWWLFFRRDAFIPDAQGKAFVQRVHEGSATYARRISDKLKELVFEEVMPEIAGGFVAYRRQQLKIQAETEESLRQIYQASLSLLYKLLFLLYAEGRGLLPMANSGYREGSLTAMAGWAADRLDSGLPISSATHAAGKYDALLALFSRIDQGDPSLGVPRYNGGLFNPASPENQFLAQHKLSDRAVARAVDILVRDAGQPVDYAYIGVRNLGAIYEGLLENRLRVIDAAAGRVELVNDKGERKASGSYYTPDYIVEYIVQHTLEPILVEREIAFSAAMDRCAGLRRQLQRAPDKTAVSLLRGQLDEAERDAREAFLGIKALDPAMGSGHFLVNAVDHLTDGIIQRLQTYHDRHPDIPWAWNPIQKLVETLREQILAEMERQGIALDPERLDDTALLTRLVMKRCIYGVDLNPMAVELAKLSLWLHSFTIGAPLSFLDHHLRWGNSLIGTDVRTVEREIQTTDQGGALQLGLFAGPFAGLLDLTSLMTEVAEQADATLADVRHSAETFERFQQELTPYKQALDLWVSQYFGNEAVHEFMTVHGEDVLPALRGRKGVADPYQAAIKRARTLWQEKRFFHWDLEFPEVFVDLRRRDWAENPGFDAVIGNPPYGLTEALPWFADLHTDAFVYFWAQAVARSKRKGMLSLITPSAWLTGLNYQGLRESLLNGTQIVSVIGLPYDVFADAYIDTCIAVVRVEGSTTGNVNVKQMGKREDSTELGGLALDVLDSRFWRNDPYKKLILTPAAAHMQRFFALPQFVKLGDLIRVERGVQPYSRSKHTDEQIKMDFLRLFDTPPAELQDVYFPELLGEELSRHQVLPAKRTWLKYSEELASKRDLEFFTLPRVVLRRLLSRRRELMAAVTSERLITTDNILNILVLAEGMRETYISSLLNSKLIAWLYTNTSTISVKDDFPQVTYEELKSLPVPKVIFATPDSERQRYSEKGRRLYDQFCSKNDYACVRGFVSHHLEAGRSDVVHDLLAFLAEQMMAMNKEKQGRLRAFRLDLAGYLDEKHMAKLNRLYTPKKPPSPDVKNYPQRLAAYEQAAALAGAQLAALAGETLDLDDFWRLSQAQWMWLLRQNLGQVDNMSALVQVYQEYHTQLAPLMRRLGRTDWLIDQIVYQLYGLTEEEIAVVEGRTG